MCIGYYKGQFKLVSDEFH